jgi:hypothetical protein
MIHLSAFCLELARMELRGITFDMRRYNALLEKRAEVIDLVTREVNATCPVFIGGQLSRKGFLGWCAANDIGWPPSRSDATGKKTLSLDKRTFERMKDRHPFVGQVHEANKTCKQLNDRTLIVDQGRGKHYFTDLPLGQATGRTSFIGFLFQAPKWMRWLAVPSSPEHHLISVDYTAQEILIAAYLSGDTGMAAGYVSGDPHMAFAIAAGAAPLGATKATHGGIRAKYKIVNLATNYGQSAYGMAQSTGMHYQEAKALLAQH